MSRHFNSYEEKCKITCTDNGNILDVEVLNFKPQAYLDVSVNRSFKLQLKYNDRHNIYVGSMSNYEFTTSGPKLLK